MPEAGWPPQDPAQLRAFVEAIFGLPIPDRAVCPGHVSPWAALCAAYFAHDRIAVWKASRGFGGKSTLLALLGILEGATLGADVTILGGSGEQSRRVHATQAQLWREARGAVEEGERQTPIALYFLRSDPALWWTRYRWGNTVIALKASRRAVRGPHPPRLRLDEVDEIDLPLLDAAMGQAMTRPARPGRVEVPAQTVLSSTHQHPFGTMTEILTRAAARGWPVYRWCYRETLKPHGWLDAAEVQAKRGDVTEAMWAWEYELQEPRPEHPAFAEGALGRLFRPTLGLFAGADGEVIEVEPPAPRARYGTGVDWARTTHWTVFVTVRADVRPMRVVGFERFRRRDWPAQIQRLAWRHGHYGGHPRHRICHDATGLGDVLGEHGFSTVPVEDVKLQGTERQDLLTEYVAAVERGDLESPEIQAMLLEHTMASQDHLYGRAHLPDTIAAGALARRAAMVAARLGTIQAPVGVGERPSYWRG